MEQEDYIEQLFFSLKELFEGGAKYIAIKGFPQGDHELLFEQLPSCVEEVLIQSSADRRSIGYFTVRPCEGSDIRDCDEWRIAFENLSTMRRYSERKGFFDDARDVAEKGSMPVRVISSVIDKMSQRHGGGKLKDLSDAESELVEKLNYYARKHTSVIFCEGIINWNKASLNFLERVMRKNPQDLKFTQNTFFIVFDTPIANGKLWEPHRQIEERDKVSTFASKASWGTTKDESIFGTAKFLTIPKQNRPMLQATLSRFTDGMKAIGKEADEMLSFASHDLEKLNLICQALNSGYRFTEKEESEKELLYNLLSSRLKAHDVPQSDIKKVLKYASLLGLTFSKAELYKLANTPDDLFCKIIEHSKAADILTESHEFDAGDTKFAQRFVYSLIKEWVNESDRDACLSVERHLSEFHPGKYEQRAELFFKGGKIHRATDCYMLMSLQQARLDESTDKAAALLDTTLNCGYMQRNKVDAYRKYLWKMLDAYGRHRRHHYNQALDIISDIDTNMLPSVFQVEANLLYALCAAKSIDSSKREEALHSLEDSLELMGCGGQEVEVWERASIQCMIMYIHVNNRSRARELEQNVIKSLEHRKDVDRDALCMRYSLDRVAIALNDVSKARIRGMNAAAFFRIEKEDDLWKPIGLYYRSLVNLAASQVVCGRFPEAQKTVMTAARLIEDFEDYRFPRQEILVNTSIVLAVLMKKIDPQEAIKRYDNIATLYDGAAENLFFVSNKAIMFALTNDFESAFHTLDQEARKHAMDSDLEKIYRYRYKVNCASFLQLQGEHDRAVQLVEELCDDDVGGSDKAIEGGRLAMIKGAIRDNVRMNSGWEWQDKLSPSKESPYCDEPFLYDYYGSGFVFTTCSDWDI